LALLVLLVPRVTLVLKALLVLLVLRVPKVRVVTKARKVKKDL
jgi:hypothetical protein